MGLIGFGVWDVNSEFGSKDPITIIIVFSSF